VTYNYRPEVLAALLVHGVRPTPHTDPELVRAYVRDLYKYEIRRLRARYLRREFGKAEYSIRVDALRRHYPVLALLPHQFLVSDPGV
jgi:hypothetical protein